MNINRIYLDMDGVLAMFVEAICDLHKLPNPYIERPAESAGNWEIEKLLGISEDDFWTVTGQSFWSQLEKYPTADDLVARCAAIVGMSNIWVLTSPVRKERGNEVYNACLDGKRLWVAKHFPQFSGRTLFAKMKDKYSDVQSLLIDDKPSNIERFQRKGGSGILVPRLWNSEYKLAGNSHDHVVSQLEWFGV